MGFDLETYIKTMGKALKEILKNLENFTTMLCETDIQIKQLKENDVIQNKKIDQILASLEKLKTGVTINNNVEVDLTDRQVAGKCKYTDEQLYCMHYNVGGKFGKAYSYSELVNMTGMSSTYLKRRIKNYKIQNGLED